MTSPAMLPDDRNTGLYYDQALDLLPHERYNATFASAARGYVREFRRDVWREIR